MTMTTLVCLDCEREFVHENLKPQGQNNKPERCPECRKLRAKENKARYSRDNPWETKADRWQRKVAAQNAKLMACVDPVTHRYRSPRIDTDVPQA